MEVHMVMYYKDMRSVTLGSSALRFKLPKKLNHFPSDYDPSNPTQNICIELVSSLAVSLVKEKILPLVQQGQTGA
jgi:hypothetical protein